MAYRLLFTGALRDGWRGVFMVYAMYASYYIGLIRALERLEKEGEEA
jgi:hypothetical protein